MLKTEGSCEAGALRRGPKKECRDSMIHKAELFNGWMHVEHSAPAEPGSPKNRCRLNGKRQFNYSTQHVWLPRISIISNLSKRKEKFQIRRHDMTWLSLIVLLLQVMWRFKRPVARNWVRRCVSLLFWRYQSMVDTPKADVSPKGPEQHMVSQKAARSRLQSQIRTMDRGRGTWEAVLLAGCEAPEVIIPKRAEHARDFTFFWSYPQVSLWMASR